MKNFFNPASIAVIGASPTPEKIGHVLLRNLLNFPGKIYPVHPTAKEVLGRTAFANVESIPEKVDLALLAIPPDAVLSTLKDCAAAKVGAAVIYSGGWAETGDKGKSRQQEVQEYAKAHQIRLLGPNTSGFLFPERQLYATFVADIAQTIGPGSLAIVSQSGGMNLSLCFLAQNEGLGVRMGIGLGNTSDIDWTDVLDFLQNDEKTGAILLAIEGVKNGRALMAAVQKLTEHRPVIALKVGRTDVSEFAASHTGAMTGDDRLTRAALRQAGAIVVDGLRELLDVARAMEAIRLKPIKNPGVGIVTGQAGPGLLLADLLSVKKVSLPPLPDDTQKKLASLLPSLTYQKNPVDTGRPSATFEETIQTVSNALEIDLVVVSLLHEPDVVQPEKILQHVRPALFVSQGPNDLMISLRERLKKINVPMYFTQEQAANAIAALMTDSKTRWLRDNPGAVTAKPIPRFRPESNHWDENSAKDLLEQLGIATPQRMVCSSHAEAKSAFEKLGKRVAIKLLHPDVRHKTERGGVHFVGDHPALEEALRQIDQTSGTRYLVEEMIPPGSELLLGARSDTSFGNIVVLGVGGIGTESENDLSLRLAPFSFAQAKTMLHDLQGSWRYQGSRGGLAVDEEELAKVLVTLGSAILERQDLSDIEINPMRVTPKGLIALDALIIDTK